MMNLETVIEGCRKGDTAMQKELYEQYSPRFFALCRRYASDDETAREALIEGFITVFKGIENYRGTGSFEGWMHSIFIRTAVRLYRDEKRRHRYFEYGEELGANGGNPNIDNQIDLRDALVESLQCLPRDERAVFNLVAVEEYTLADAAESLSIPESTAKSRYYRAVEKMRKMLEKRLGREYLKNL